MHFGALFCQVCCWGNGSHKEQWKGFSESNTVHEVTAGNLRFLNIPLNRPCVRNTVNTATWQCHTGWEPLTITIEGHWSISHSLCSTSPAAETAWLPAHFPGVAYGIALPYILFICLCICEELRYSLLLFVLLGKMVQQMVKKMNRPVVSETNNSLRGESTLHLCAYSVFVMLSSSLRGPFEGQ